MCGRDRLRAPDLWSAWSHRVDRRTVLKGATAIGALTLAGGAVARRAGAQDAPVTRASTWVEADNAAPGAAVAAASSGTTRTFQSDFTFYAVAPHWSSDGDPDALVQISYSSDGIDWSDPITVSAASTDAGPPDRDNRHFGQLIVTPGGGNYVKYEALDANGDPAQIPGLAFTYIDASNGPSISDVGPAATDPTVAQPPVISRADWGCDESLGLDSQGNVIWPPEYQTVEHVIVHHSDAGVDNFYDPLLLIRSIYYYHTVTRGWGDIGYNYLVDFMGHIYEGRKGGENVVGGHAFQYAHGSSGICCMGTFMTQEETPEALSGLTWITAWVGRKLDPYGHADFHETANLSTICGHRDVLQSTCPGDMLEADLGTLRDKVSAVLQGANPAQHPQYNVGDVVTVIVDQSNLRSSPGTSYDVVAQLPLGATLTITDGPTTNQGYTWYEVSGNAGTGWIASILIQAQNTDGGTPKFNTGDQVAVTTDRLNLRSSPSLSGSVIAVLLNGTQGGVVDGPQSADGYTWYKLDTSSGVGWAVQDYLELASSPPPSGKFKVGDTVVVTTDLLNLRQSAGLSGAVVGKMPNGTQGSVTAGPTSADGYTWYQLNTSVGTGWAADTYLALSTNPPANKFKVGDTVVVDTDALNLRSAASLSANVVATMPNGTLLSVTGGPSTANGYTWWGLESTQYGSGWSVEDFLAASTPSASDTNGGASGGLQVGGEAKVFDGRLNMRAQAGTSANVVAVLPDGTMVDVLYGPVSADGSDWYQVRNSTYGTGWCVAQYLQPA